MIVTCPQCNSRYRVREEKLPASGGNIQCPACGRIFTALPGVGSGGHDALPIGELTTTQEDDWAPPTTALQLDGPETPVGEAFQSPRLPSDAYESPAAQAPSHDEDTAVVSRSTLARSFDTDAPTRPGPKTAADQWKLRSPVGLVYDFPDLNALTTWLSNRDSVDGMSASRDGGKTWHLLNTFGELRGALPRAALSRMGPTTGGGRRPKSVTGSADATTLLRPDGGGGAPRTGGGATRSAEAGAGSRGPEVGPSEAREALGGRAVEARHQDLSAAPAAPPTERPTARPALRSGPQPPVSPRTPTVTADATAVRHRPSLRTASSGRYTPVGGRRRPARPRPSPRRAGMGTWIGLSVALLVIAVAAVQISGLYDVAGALGLRPSIQTRETQAPPAPAPPAQPATASAQTVPEAAESPTVPDLTSERERALELLEQQRGGGNPHAARVLALARRARDAADEGRIEDAIDLLDNALRFDRNNAEVVCLMADLQRQAGSLDVADSYAHECDVLQDPSRGVAYDSETEP